MAPETAINWRRDFEENVVITVGMNYSVRPGKEEQFVRVFAKVLDVIRDSPGHVKTNLYRDVFAENEFAVVSEWNDEAAFQAFIASDRFRSVTDWGKENVLAARPRHQIYGANASNAAGKQAD